MTKKQTWTKAFELVCTVFGFIGMFFGILVLYILVYLESETDAVTSGILLIATGFVSALYGMEYLKITKKSTFTKKILLSFSLIFTWIVILSFLFSLIF